MIDFLAQAIAGICVALVGVTSPYNTPATECSEHDGIQYCFYAGAEGTDKLIYFMHGFGNDVTGWTRNPVEGRIDDYWKTHQIARPNVVTVSKGEWWYTEHEHGEQLNAFVQWFETSYLKLKSKPKRIFYGESMGAHNGFRWMIDFPNQFERVALTCPAMPKYFVAHPVDGPFAKWELLSTALVSAYYGESSHPDFNPLQLPETLAAEQFTPRAHIIVSNRDDLGFYPGGVALHEMLAKNPSMTVTFEEQSINHCDPDISQLAPFLAEETP